MQVLELVEEVDGMLDQTLVAVVAVLVDIVVVEVVVDGLEPLQRMVVELV